MNLLNLLKIIESAMNEICENVAKDCTKCPLAIEHFDCCLSSVIINTIMEEEDKTESRGDRMSNANFTPGPWQVGRGYEIRHAIKGWKYYPIHYGHDEENVCDIVYNKADADLIAAAPEMYEALEEAVREYCGWDECFQQDCQWKRAGRECKAIQWLNILRKARGESEVSE